MYETHLYYTKENFNQVVNTLQSRLSRIKEMNDFFIEEMMKEKK